MSDSDTVPEDVKKLAETVVADVRTTRKSWRYVDLAIAAILADRASRPAPAPAKEGEEAKLWRSLAVTLEVYGLAYMEQRHILSKVQNLVSAARPPAPAREGAQPVAWQARELAEAIEALRPFAAVWTESMLDFPDGSSREERPDDKPAWGFNNAELDWGDFRRAHSVASRSSTRSV